MKIVLVFEIHANIYTIKARTAGISGKEADG
jgi:hypothetical protein